MRKEKQLKKTTNKNLQNILKAKIEKKINMYFSKMNK